jgi:protein ImuB
VIWADARGLPAGTLARDLLALVHDDGVRDVRAGVASTPVAAHLAAVQGKEGVTVVAPGRDRAFVALFPLDALDVPPRVKPLLFGIGVDTCGALAALERESVEVRLGADAVPLWRLARADDDRVHTIFAPIPRELPHATLDWMDYEVTDPARLLFVINALLERVCDALAQTGEGARELAVAFSLASRETHTETLRASRATANRQTWIRLVRGALDRMKLHSAVTGIAVRATRVSGREDRQGDLFDKGLVSEDATANALARLIEDQGDVVMTPVNSGHPLLEKRAVWEAKRQGTQGGQEGQGGQGGQRGQGAPDPRQPALGGAAPRRAAVAGLSLQLAPVPQPVMVETVPRRDHMVPARYRDARGWHEVVNAAGPDRVSGGTWDSAKTYAREYFRCVTRDGVLVWLFRNARGNRASTWYLHGWWD